MHIGLWATMTSMSNIAARTEFFVLAELSVYVVPLGSLQFQHLINGNSCVPTQRLARLSGVVCMILGHYLFEGFTRR